MQLSESRRNLGKTAAVLGTLQGLAWAAMSLASIIMYNWSPVLEVPTTYTSGIGYLLYIYFLQDNNGPSTFIIRPLDFTIFMWIYFIMSVGWLALSIDQYSAIQYNKGRQKQIIFLWGVVTLIISLIDLIFTSLLARDYASCSDSTTEISLYNCYLSFGIAMTLAARGYTLWVVNVAFSFNMMYIATHLGKDRKLEQYSPSIPRVILPRSTKSFANKERDVSPNFLNNENIYQSYLGDIRVGSSLQSTTTRSDRGTENSVPSFLTRGEKFSY